MRTPAVMPRDDRTNSTCGVIEWQWGTRPLVCARSGPLSGCSDGGHFAYNSARTGCSPNASQIWRLFMRIAVLVIGLCVSLAGLARAEDAENGTRVAGGTAAQAADGRR